MVCGQAGGRTYRHNNLSPTAYFFTAGFLASSLCVSLCSAPLNCKKPISAMYRFCLLRRLRHSHHTASSYRPCTACSTTGTGTRSTKSWVAGSPAASSPSSSPSSPSPRSSRPTSSSFRSLGRASSSSRRRRQPYFPSASSPSGSPSARASGSPSARASPSLVGAAGSPSSAAAPPSSLGSTFLPLGSSRSSEGSEGRKPVNTTRARRPDTTL